MTYATDDALAGTYQVMSSGSAPAGGADDAWIFETNAPQKFERVDGRSGHSHPAPSCPPQLTDTPTNLDGSVGYDVFGWPLPPVGRVTGIAAWDVSACSQRTLSELLGAQVSVPDRGPCAR
jgi:hypothetical protein